MTTTAPDVRSGTPRRVRWAGRAAAFAVVVLAGWLAWASLGWSPTPYDDVRPLGDDRLWVSWTNRPCENRMHVVVDESDSTVRILIRTQPLADGCTQIGEGRAGAAVYLDRPLGDRRIVNAACDRKEFADHPACQDG